MKIILLSVVASLLVCNLESATIVVTNNTQCLPSKDMPSLVISILIYILESKFTNSTTSTTTTTTSSSTTRIPFGSLVNTLTGHTGYVARLATLPNGNLASGSYDKTVRIWNTNTGSLVYTLTGHLDAIYTLVTLPNGNLASGSQDKTIKIWNPNTGSLVNTLTGHTSSVYTLATLTNGNLASG